MGEIWRSEEMQKVQLFVQIEAAHDTVYEMGKLGLIQFIDFHEGLTNFQRNFVNEVRRCAEMERKLNFFEEEITKEKKEILVEKGKNADDLENYETVALFPEDSAPEKKSLSMDEMENHFDELEKELIQMNNNQVMLNRNYTELVELRHVLVKDANFFFESPENMAQEEEKGGLLNAPGEVSQKTIKLGFYTGVINRSEFGKFEKILWRATRGNLFMKHEEIEEQIKDPQTGESHDKNVFIIFYQGERSQVKIKKICESYGAHLYPCPDSAKERKELQTQVEGRLEDLKSVLAKTKKHRRKVLLDLAKKSGAWKKKVVEERRIYSTMNLFNYDVGRRCLIAEGWCPKYATEKIVNAMRVATESSGALVPSILSVVQTTEDPPTFFKTNRFTAGFQALVDAYGCASYQEVNPAVFSIVTFPFLFAVMFGDVGHGFLLTLFAGYLVWKEKELGAQKLNELLVFCYGGRYLLLLMGLFSMYVGLIYNEFFSVPLDIFVSNWELSHNTGNNTSINMVQITPGRTYPFGVDPAWNGAANSLTFYNSLKMKLAIIFGITQMSLGIFMSLLNALHFGHILDIFTEFIPQILFLWSLFGWLCFLIIYKWCVGFGLGSNPPLLLNVMIQMFLSLATITDENRIFTGQLYVQWILILIAVVCVPWMLLSKPLILRRRHKKQQGAHPLKSEDVDIHEDGKPAAKKEESHGGHGHGHDGNFDFGEIMIKQTIHTIEFVLGAISNTASYLRLWALSLAHSELSVVFWERIFLLVLGLPTGLNIIGTFIGFAVWAGLTVGVLMVMETLSAFLHALRLHWVEFQSKFYHGEGHFFRPFSFAVPEGDNE